MYILYVWVVKCVALQVENINDQVRDNLILVKKGNAAELNEKAKNDLKKRTLLTEM